MMQSSPMQAQQAGELVIHNGLIINENGRMEADIRIKGEKIVEIALNGDEKAMLEKSANSVKTIVDVVKKN